MTLYELFAGDLDDSDRDPISLGRRNAELPRVGDSYTLNRGDYDHKQDLLGKLSKLGIPMRDDGICAVTRVVHADSAGEVSYEVYVNSEEKAKE